MHLNTSPHYTPTPTYQHTNPTNAPIPCIPTLPLHTYPTYLHYLYKPTKPYIPTRPLRSYDTPTTPTAQHTLHYTLHTGPTPAHLLNEHVVRRCGCVLPVIGYCVLRHVLAKVLHLNLLEPPEEGKGIEFPRKTCNSGRLHNDYYYTYTYVYTQTQVHTHTYTYILHKRAQWSSVRVIVGVGSPWHL